MLRPRVGVVGLNGWTGGVVYVQNLVRALAGLPENERPFLSLVYSMSPGPFQGLTPLVDVQLAYHPRFVSSHGSQRLAVLWRRLAGITLGESHVELAGALREAQVDVAFPVTHLLNRLTPQAIVWIPDFQYRWLPDMFSKKDRFWRDFGFRIHLKRRGDIVVSSEHAKADALRFFGRPRARLHVLRFTTVPDHSWYQDFGAVVSKYNLPRNYLIICNQFWAHKDHQTVFKAVQLLKDKDVNVVCTGVTSDPRHPGFFSELTAQIKELGIESQVFVLGLIPRNDQMLLMRGASAVMQPSLFEGWNTSLEDARALGKPVIASDFPVHLEQDVPGAIYFRRGDSLDCARAIEEHRYRYGDEIVAASSPAEQWIRVTEYARSFMRIAALCYTAKGQRR